MLAQRIEDVKIVLNDFFEIADVETLQRDLTNLVSFAMSTEEFENLNATERTNLIFRLLKCQEFIRSVHKFSDWS